jgi:hypothetical protein
MKFISFKILISCILLPPVLYIFSIQSIESHLKRQYANEIEDIYTGDTRPLFEGNVGLKDAINKNIDLYLESKSLISWGVQVYVTVTTKQGTVLYPAVFEEEDGSLQPPDPMQVAADNYKLMNEGLMVNVDLILKHNKMLSNAILAFYISLSVLILYFYYRAGINKAGREEKIKDNEISRLMELEKNYADNLEALVLDRQNLTSEIFKIKKKLENEKIKATRNEEEMINEIVELEEKINKNITLQKEKQDEIDVLKEKAQYLEKGRRKESKQKAKSIDSASKRFKTLYKNISVNERAISGFMDLSHDMKIKGEEIIHKLNEDPKFVPIKRKVFGKKGRTTVQEVIFAYKGRLYFRKAKDYKIEVLAIGTKNTQAKDLEFLNNI